jgi:hypothetical protein
MARSRVDPTPITIFRGMVGLRDIAEFREHLVGPLKKEEPRLEHYAPLIGGPPERGIPTRAIPHIPKWTGFAPPLGEPKYWVPSVSSVEYEVSDQLTLRRIDGTPVGWMSVSRYADVVGVPRREMIARMIGWKVRGAPRVFDECNQAPWVDRSVDALPGHMFVNFLPVKVHAVPLGNGFGTGTMGISYMAHILAHVKDAMTLSYGVHLFQDFSLRGLKETGTSITRISGREKRVNPIYTSPLDVRRGISVDTWYLCDPEVGNPLHAHYCNPLKNPEYAMSLQARLALKHAPNIADDDKTASALVARAVETKFTAMINLLQHGTLRRAGMTARTLGRRLRHGPYAEVAAKINQALMHRGNKVAEESDLENWTDSVVMAASHRETITKGAAQARALLAELTPLTLDAALAQIATIDAETDMVDPVLQAVPDVTLIGLDEQWQQLVALWAEMA